MRIGLLINESICHVLLYQATIFLNDPRISVCLMSVYVYCLPRKSRCALSMRWKTVRKQQSVVTYWPTAADNFTHLQANYRSLSDIVHAGMIRTYDSLQLLHAFYRRSVFNTSVLRGRVCSRLARSVYCTTDQAYIENSANIEEVLPYWCELPISPTVSLFAYHRYTIRYR